MVISFLVTYYNQEKYVKRSLDNIFKQQLRCDFEIIVGDDGSTDNTLNIVRQYQEQYPNKIRIIVQKRDKNLSQLSVERASQNRLAILNEAKGKYVCFLDGDDSYCNFTFIQSAIDDLEKFNEYIGVAHNHVVVKNDKTIESQRINFNRNIITLKDYIDSLYIHVGAIVFRKPEKNQIEKVELLHSFDDNDITYFFLNSGNLLYKNIDVYNYFSNDDGICSSINIFEMKLLNAIDYQIIKQIITKNHFALFVRYFNSMFYVYKNREKLNDPKYEKWIEWCKRIKVTIPYVMKKHKPHYIYIIKVLIDLYSFIQKIINKCKKIIKEIKHENH